MLAIPRVKPLGWVDDEQLTAAQITQMDLNISLLDGALSTFVHAGSMQFTRTDLNVGTSTMTLISPVQQTNLIGAPANRQKLILIAGASSIALPEGALLHDGTTPPVAFDGLASLAGASVNSAPASDSSGTIFYGLSDGVVAKSSDGLATVTAVTITGLTTGADWVGFTETHYLAFESATNTLYTSVSLTGTWTAVATAFAQIHALITDGAGLWVLVGQQNGGAIHTMRSSDDGATWASSAPGTSPSGLGAAWSQAWGVFVIVDGNGKFWTSTDAVTWTITKTVAALDSALMATTWGQNSVAACGQAIACLANRGVDSLGKYANGIAYTLDLGATWYEAYIGDTSDLPFTNLISANGRFYAIDGSSLYQSGVLETPPTLFTGV